jgi:predicted permease
MALSVVLLIGAGLLFQSFRRVQHVPLGFDPGHVLTARVALPTSKYADGTPRARFAHDLAGRLQALPGVTVAAISQSVPFRGLLLSPVLADGQPVVPPGQRPLAQWNGATPGYFRALGIPLLRGRDFTWADDERSPRVIVVSESLARQFWPSQNPLGKHLTFTRFQVPFEIVGVVADTRTRAVETAPMPIMYTAYAQWTWQAISITVRTQGGTPGALGRAMAAQVSAIDRDLPTTQVGTMDDLVAATLLQRRQTLYLIGGFATVALVLAVLGLYGMMAYSVAQRTAEFGIRQAIGAQRSDILRMVVAQSLRLSVAGVGVGMLAALALTRLIARMLFGVAATDPLVYGVIAAVFLLVATAASLGPAWRATRVDPIEALR